MNIKIVSFSLIILTACGSDEPEELFGSNGSIWPGPTNEFNEWLNRDLDCRNFVLNLSGTANAARPPNDPDFVENTYWSSTSFDGVLVNEGTWYTSRSDQFTESRLILNMQDGGSQSYRLTTEGLTILPGGGVICTVI